MGRARPNFRRPGPGTGHHGVVVCEEPFLPAEGSDGLPHSASTLRGTPTVMICVDFFHLTHRIIGEEGQCLHTTPQPLLYFVRGALYVLQTKRSAVVLVVVFCLYKPNYILAQTFLLRADLQSVDGYGERIIRVTGEYFRAASDNVLPVTRRYATSPVRRRIYAYLLPIFFPQQRKRHRCQECQDILGYPQLLPVEVSGIYYAHE